MSAAARESRRLNWLLLLLALPPALAVIVVPLDLRNQWFFAAGLIVAVLVANRFKTRQATLVVCILTMLASTRYIWWRTTQTLSFSSPLEFLIGIGLYLAEFYAWVILTLGFLQTIWPLRRPPVPLKGPTDQLPTVDVYIPTYNESLGIVRTTVFAAMAMDYPADRFRVFILDDGRRPEFRDFARAAGCGYLTRSDNLHAKAGNLNAAMKRTDGELICVFDCDHVPTRAFLQMTVGWFQQDAKLALLQTPHHFYSPDPVQRNVRAVQDMPGEGELFYGAVQSGNDLWNATFFCGSCAIIRRAALAQTNGFAGETVTEDAHTALKLQRMGWGTAYINARLSAGLATERLVLHIGQRIRWARGMTQIFRIDNPLTGRGLSIPQRLCYLNAMLHFQFPLPRIVFLTSPLAYLIAGQNVIHASAAMIFAYAVPHLFATTKSSERLQGSERRPFWGEIYETLLAFHLVKPTVLTLFNPRKGKFNVTDKGATLDVGFFDYRTLRPHLITAGLLILGIVIGFVKLFFPQMFDVHVSTLMLNTAWTLFNLLILISAITVGRETRQTRDTVRFTASLPVTLYFEDGHVVDARSINVSMGGIAIRGPERFDSNGRVVSHVGLRVRGQSFVLPVETVAVSGGLVRVRFSDLSLAEERRLAEALMGRADAWQHTAYHKMENSIESIMDIAKVSASTLVAGGGSVRRPRQLVTAVASAMAIMFGIAILLGVLGGIANARPPAIAAPTAAPARQPGAGVETMRLTLKDLRVPDRIRLAGTQGEIGIPFGLRHDEVVTGATLTLNFAYSPTLLPDLSQLVVLLNGEVVRTVQLPRETANGLALNIPVEPALFMAGDNQLNLRFVGHYSRDCEDPLNSVLWANVSNTRSYLDLTLQKLPQARTLSALPSPFFDLAQPTPLKLPFIFAGSPGNGELEAAASVAGWLGSLASFRGYSFLPATSLPPSGNAILFVTPRRPIAGIAMPRIDGPALTVIANPRDSYGSLLLVMGRDDRELKIAAAVLATSAGTLGGDYASVADARVPIMAPYAAARWLPTDRPVRLGEIVDPLSLQGQGLPPGPLTADFRIAPDLFFWPQRGARLNIGYTYPVAPWLDRQQSRLDLSLNGQYLRTYRLSGNWWERLRGASGSTSRHGEGSATLPSYALFGQNEISLYYDLRVADKRRCTGTLPTNVKAAIDPTSTIDLRGAHHAALMPDLALLAGAGFPFTRTPDLGETAAVLPANPTATEIEAFLALMGRFGDATGTAPTRLTVLRTGDPSQLSGKDVLIVGRASLAQGPLFDGAPLHWNGHDVEIAQRSRISRAWDFLTPMPLVATAPIDQSLLQSSGVAGMASFRSPFDEQRSVVAFLASDPADLPSLVYGLGDRHMNAEVQGDLALLAGDQIRSFRVGSTYWSGSLPWWIRAGYWLSQHPLLLVIAAIVAALLLSLPLYALLRAQQRRRLAVVEKPE